MDNNQNEKINLLQPTWKYLQYFNEFKVSEILQYCINFYAFYMLELLLLWIHKNKNFRILILLYLLHVTSFLINFSKMTRHF